MRLKPTLAAATLTLVASAGVAAEQRPNIIFVLTDDQPYDMLGITGNGVLQTPNLDRLAREGILFTNAHVSSAISTPSRTCILTGRYERSHGVNFNSGTSLTAEAWEECYPVVLRKGGYYTGYVGKNHTPIGEYGYETGIIDNSFDYWYAGHRQLSFYPKSRHKIFQYAEADTQLEVLSEGVIDFLKTEGRALKGAVHDEGGRPADQPFFLNVCINAPHGSTTSSMKLLGTDPEIYRTLYRDQDIPLPEHYVARADIKNPKLPPEILHAEDRQGGYDYVDTPEALRERLIRDMETITGIDLLIGAMVEELKSQKLDKNTIIIFTSDHGIFKGQFGLGGKSLCYEICTKVPFIVYDPTSKKRQKTERDDLILALDVAPTILDYAGVEAPESYQGHSIKPLVKGDADQVRDYLFTENLWSTVSGNPRCESIQDKEWKYIRYYQNDNYSLRKIQEHLGMVGLPETAATAGNISEVWLYRFYAEAPFRGEKAIYEELYNVGNDPKEVENLIGDSQYNDILERLRLECDKGLKMARGEKRSTKVHIDVKGYTAAKAKTKK